MDDQNIVIIGGGIVGLAIAYELSLKYDNIFLLEKLSRVGEATSSRNSGVIHAGIYYAKGSLKARLCVEGNRILYEFAQRHRISNEMIGKVIVATSDNELEALENLRLRGEENGARLFWLSRDELRIREPNVNGVAALYSPNSGIINQIELATCLNALFQNNRGILLTNTCVTGIQPSDQSFNIQTSNRGDLDARVVINSAGLYADEVAKMLGCGGYTIYPCRGEYFELIPQRSGIINGLVYPVRKKNSPGLGVHFTKTTTGTVMIGPNAVYVERKDDYENNRESIDRFFESARLLVSSLRIEDMRESYAGIRPKLVRQEEPDTDFVIFNNNPFPNAINLIGIESPGLTACLSIGKYVRKMVDTVLL